MAVGTEGEEYMSAEKMTVSVVDPDGKWLYRVGGISALVIGIAYIIILPLFAHVGGTPSSVSVRRNSCLVADAGKRPEWTALTSGMGYFSVQMVTLDQVR